MLGDSVGNSKHSYFTNYVDCMQTVPAFLQTSISSLLRSDVVQKGLFSVVQKLTSDVTNAEDPSGVITNLESTLIKLNEIYDEKLAELAVVSRFLYYIFLTSFHMYAIY